MCECELTVQFDACFLFFEFVAYRSAQLLEKALFFALAGLRGISRKRKSRTIMGYSEWHFSL